MRRWRCTRKEGLRWINCGYWRCSKVLQNECHVLCCELAYERCKWRSGTHRLSYTLLTVSHEQVGDLLDYRIIPMLDVTVFGKRQRRHLKFEARCLWFRRCRLNVDETHVEAAISSSLRSHGRIWPRAFGSSVSSSLELVFHDFRQLFLRRFISFYNLSKH
jgi:hypothetical protein